MATLRTLSLGLALALAQGGAGAQPAPSDSGGGALSGWTFGVSPWTVHYSQARKEHDFEPDTQRHSYVWLVQAEKALDERRIAGLALFRNSFGQPTQYLYYGWQWRPLDSTPGLFVKLTGGVIHGYKAPYHRKIPFNDKSGWGLTAIPAVGYDFSRNWGAQINVLGTAGLMFQLNYTMR